MAELECTSCSPPGVVLLTDGLKPAAFNRFSAAALSAPMAPGANVRRVAFCGISNQGIRRFAAASGPICTIHRSCHPHCVATHTHSTYPNVTLTCVEPRHRGPHRGSQSHAVAFHPGPGQLHRAVHQSPQRLLLAEGEGRQAWPPDKRTQRSNREKGQSPVRAEDRTVGHYTRECADLCADILQLRV